MKIIISTLFIFLAVGSFAQDTLKFKTVDETTYQAYLVKDWETVIQIGNNALEQEIDYYYLRMRLGIAYFEKENYRKSIIHFEEAVKMNNSEVTAVEYLFYAYKYIDNDIQAMKTLDKSNTKFANILLAKQSFFHNIYGFYSTRIYNIDGLEEDLKSIYLEERNKNPKPTYAEQFIPESYLNFQLGTSVRLSPAWRLDGSYQYFNVKHQQQILDPISTTLEESKVTQTQWHINNTIRLSNHLQANIFFSYLSQKTDYISINTSRIPFGYSRNKQGKSSNLLFGVGLNREQTYFDLLASASFLTTIKIPILQANLGVNIYPFGNRKLFSETEVSFLKTDSTKPNLIFSQTLSYSPHERIRLSLSGHWGEMQYWNNENGYSIYNGIQGLNELYQAKITVRIVKQLYLKVYYEYMSNYSKIWSKSLVPMDSKDIPEVVGDIKFNTHSIIGGLIWEF